MPDPSVGIQLSHGSAWPCPSVLSRWIFQWWNSLLKKLIWGFRFSRFSKMRFYSLELDNCYWVTGIKGGELLHGCVVLVCSRLLPILELEGILYVLGYFVLLCVAKLRIIYSSGGNKGDFVLKLGKKRNKLNIPIRSLCLSRLKSTLGGTGTCSAGLELLKLGLALGFCTGCSRDGKRILKLFLGTSFPQHSTCSHFMESIQCFILAGMVLNGPKKISKSWEFCPSFQEKLPGGFLPFRVRFSWCWSAKSISERLGSAVDVWSVPAFAEAQGALGDTELTGNNPGSNHTSAGPGCSQSPGIRRLERPRDHGVTWD